ncbi:hypothetical protein ACFV23_43680 [Streptomyces sp. NPDC059627]
MRGRRRDGHVQGQDHHRRTGGAFKTTVKAAADGYYRFSFATNATTGAATATGEYVDVK